MNSGKTSLVIVDMQKYYLSRESSYSRFFSRLDPHSMDYILHRCHELVIPNIQKLCNFFTDRRDEIIFLKLCGKDPERRDIHKAFAMVWEIGKAEGYDDIYPLESEPDSAIIDELSPKKNAPGITIISKTTYSPFTFTPIDNILKAKNISRLVFTGLATSQCVETSARDAADRGYEVIHIEDAQADYTEETHTASLFSSRGVCGGNIYKTADFINSFKDKL